MSRLSLQERHRQHLFRCKANNDGRVSACLRVPVGDSSAASKEAVETVYTRNKTDDD